MLLIEKGDYMNGKIMVVNDRSLSYKSMISKLIILGCIILFGIYWILSGNATNNMDSGIRIFVAISYFVGLYICFFLFYEWICIYTNRQLMYISKYPVADLESQRISRERIIEILKNKPVRIIIKNEYSVHFILPLQDKQPELGKKATYIYYLEKVLDEQLDRIEYQSFEQFISILDQINGYGDYFDVVAIGKIKVPKQKNNF